MCLPLLWLVISKVLKLCNTRSRTCGRKSGVGACSGRKPAVCGAVKLRVAGLLQRKEWPRAGEASTSAPTAAAPEQAKPRKFRSSWDAKEASAGADSKVDYLTELGRAEYNINVTHGARHDFWQAHTGSAS